MYELCCTNNWCIAEHSTPYLIKSELGLYVDVDDATPTRRHDVGAMHNFIVELNDKLYSTFCDVTPCRAQRQLRRRGGLLAGVILDRYLHRYGSGVTLVLSCDNVENLDQLWYDFELGRLKEEINDLYLSPSVLDAIGVSSVQLRAQLLREEFERCRQELNDEQIQLTLHNYRPTDMTMLQRVRQSQRMLTLMTSSLKDEASSFAASSNEFMVTYKRIMPITTLRTSCLRDFYRNIDTNPTAPAVTVLTNSPIHNYYSTISSSPSPPLLLSSPSSSHCSSPSPSPSHCRSPSISLTTSTSSPSVLSSSLLSSSSTATNAFSTFSFPTMNTSSSFVIPTISAATTEAPVDSLPRSEMSPAAVASPAEIFPSESRDTVHAGCGHQSMINLRAINRFHNLLATIRSAVAFIDRDVVQPLGRVRGRCESPRQRTMKGNIEGALSSLEKSLDIDFDVSGLSYPCWRNKVIIREDGLFIGLLSLITYCVEMIDAVCHDVDEYMSGVGDVILH